MIKVLDCTLRDGGYYNEWDFDSEVVASYLTAMAKARVDYVELGLRNFAKSGFLGAFAYTTEAFLQELELPEGPIYGVMVDAKTILSSELPLEQAMSKLFVHADVSKIGLVRVAAHFHEVESSGEIVKWLSDNGYIVGFNLMQAGGKSTEVIAEKAKLAQSWGVLDTLYFADSLGNMDSVEVSRIYDAVRLEWQGPIGIHTHNNMARAIDNTLTARDKGVTWLDVTVTGMGRGAGNAQTETLLAILSKETDTYEPAPVYELAIRHFEPLQHSYGWGSNLLYFLGAQNDIHPTYIQNLLSDTHYGTDEVVGAIDYLSKLDNTTSYKGDILAKALSSNSTVESVSGTAELVGLAKNREILILADGPSLNKYASQLSVYIKQRNPIVIAINNLNIASDLVDYYCVTHNTKFLSEKDEYSRIAKPVVLPKHRFTEQELSAFSSNVNLYDYGLEVVNGEFNAHDSKCVVPYDVTAAYALAIAYTMSAEKVSLMGFDGYDAHDPRQLEMLKLWSLVENYAGFCDVVAITPTSYPIPQGSIYAPV